MRRPARVETNNTITDDIKAKLVAYETPSLDNITGDILFTGDDHPAINTLTSWATSELQKLNNAGEWKRLSGL